MNKFIKDSEELLNSLPSLAGDSARVAHRLSRALNAIKAISEIELNRNKTVGELVEFNHILEEI